MVHAYARRIDGALMHYNFIHALGLLAVSRRISRDLILYDCLEVINERTSGILISVFNNVCFLGSSSYSFSLCYVI